MTAMELENFLKEQIPITLAIGVHVVSADDARVEITCPLSVNHNHLGTAFGGSLAAVAILAGYAWIFRALITRGHDVHVVLKSTSIDYLKPVEEDLRAVCEAPPAPEFEKFVSTFERKGLARLTLRSVIETASGVACSLTGEFVAKRST